ncbi:MAG TPA: metalloregulator ArsR/SmtB family transcription factor [Tepidisphaeraceae bacterium]|nr:metalloregulator ArsR/SmtB family transcription factor [Tepidisphaeraceae bacterium]
MKRTPSSAQCSKLLKAVADPERLRIIELLRDGAARPVTEIATELRLPMQNASHHLKLLRTAGIVTAAKAGRFVRYALAAKYASKPTAPGRSLDVLDFGCCRLELGDRPAASRDDR